jgi:hypothetical protein
VKATAARLGGFVPHLFLYGSDLGRAVGIAQDEIVGQQRYLLHVQHNDVRAKALGDRIDNCMGKF